MSYCRSNSVMINSSTLSKQRALCNLAALFITTLTLTAYFISIDDITDIPLLFTNKEWRQVRSTTDLRGTSASMKAGHLFPQQELLDTVKELGYIDLASGQVILPQYSVPLNFRLPIVLSYLNKYIKVNRFTAKKNQSKHLSSAFYFTLNDGFRENTEPIYTPVFSNLSISVIRQHYLGNGSMGEPRFFYRSSSKASFQDTRDAEWGSTSELSQVYPVFNLPVLSFGRHKQDSSCILIPDSDFIGSKGYTSLKQYILKVDTPWDLKLSKAVFHGANHGYPYEVYNKPETPTSHILNQRQLLVQAVKTIPNAIASFEYSNYGDMLKFKYVIDVDGFVNSWSALWWKLFSSSVVIKIDSHFEQWYYKDLIPWKHYIPVLGNMSDLQEKIEWARENDDECQRIAERGRDLVCRLTYQYVLHNYVIQ